MGSSVVGKFVGGAVPGSRPDFFARHIRPRDKAWSYEAHEYLRAIIADAVPHRVHQKGAQVCSTTGAMGELIHECEQGRDYGYYITDGGLVKSIVQGKLDPIINADPFIAASIGKVDFSNQVNLAGQRRASRKSADSIDIKQLGPGFAYFTGLQDLGDAKSISLDGYILDEVDEVNPRLAIWLRDRILHSSYCHILEMSQPSVPDFGINARFELSDQKIYLHKCPRCNTWHGLEEEWPNCLHRQGPDCTCWHPVGTTCDGCRHAKATDASALATQYRLVCLNCGARLRGAGVTVTAEWVARHPGRRDLSGYHISQLYGPAMTAARLAQAWAPCAKSTDHLENFTNSILGLPFSGGDKQPLSAEVVNKACRGWGLGVRGYLSTLPDDARPLILGGADIGDTIHAGLAVVWGETFALVDLAELNDQRLGERVVTAWEQLQQMFAVCHFSVVDGRPDHSSALKLARALPGRVALAYFRGEEFVLSEEDDGVGTLVPTVLQERTTAIDDMADLLKHEDLLLPNAKLELVKTFRRHAGKLIKAPNPKTGRKEYVKKVENHFGLAATYVEMARKAAVRLGLGPMQDFDLETSTIGGSLAAKEW